MRKLSLNMLCLLFVNTVFSQVNLISNGSFEGFDSDCGALDFNENNVTGFINPTNASVDYFNLCRISIDFRQPQNFVGFQTPKDGNAYLGIILWNSNPQWNYREYVELKINQKLKNKHAYKFSLFVCAGDSADRTYVHNIGVYFSANKIDMRDESIGSGVCGFCDVLPFVPQIENTKAKQPLNSSKEWLKIEGFFHANGDEEYLTIGNFRDNLSSEIDLNNGISFQKYAPYYYIDDVSLIEIGPVGMVDEQGKIRGAYYNTSTNTLNVSTKGYLIVYNMQGAKVLEQIIKQEENIVLPTLPKGVYVWQLQTEKDVQQGKFVVSE